MRFLCLAYEAQEIFDRMSSHEWAELRQETLDYLETLRAGGHLVDAQPLRGAAHSATLQVRDGRMIVRDGPFAETREQLGGFFMLEAADRDEAVRLAAGWPSSRLGTIEVRPVDDGLSPERRYS
jgi:hypothetical protein